MLLAKLLCVSNQKGKQSKQIRGTSTKRISTDPQLHAHTHPHAEKYTSRSKIRPEVMSKKEGNGKITETKTSLLRQVKKKDRTENQHRPGACTGKSYVFHYGCFYFHIVISEKLLFCLQKSPVDPSQGAKPVRDYSAQEEGPARLHGFRISPVPCCGRA